MVDLAEIVLSEYDVNPCTDDKLIHSIETTLANVLLKNEWYGNIFLGLSKSHSCAFSYSRSTLEVAEFVTVRLAAQTTNKVMAVLSILGYLEKYLAHVVDHLAHDFNILMFSMHDAISLVLEVGRLACPGITAWCRSKVCSEHTRMCLHSRLAGTMSRCPCFYQRVPGNICSTIPSCTGP